MTDSDLQPARTRSLRQTFASLVLVSEVLVVGFAVLVAKDLTDVPGSQLAAFAGAVALLCVLSTGLLRSRVGYLLGSLAQCLLVLAAFWLPLMAVVGLLFAALWAAALVYGSRADALTASRAVR